MVEPMLRPLPLLLSFLAPFAPPFVVLVVLVSWFLFPFLPPPPPVPFPFAFNKVLRPQPEIVRVFPYKDPRALDEQGYPINRPGGKLLQGPDANGWYSSTTIW